MYQYKNRGHYLSQTMPSPNQLKVITSYICVNFFRLIMIIISNHKVANVGTSEKKNYLFVGLVGLEPTTFRL